MNFSSHLQTVCDNETLYVKNQIYDPKHGFVFPFAPANLQSFISIAHVNKTQHEEALVSQETVHIKDPVFVIDTIDGCWSHAIIENILVWLWSYRKYMANQEIVFVIRKRLLDCYPDNYKSISADQTKFTDKYEQLLSVIPHKYILLEKNIKSLHCFDHCFHYTLEDDRQRSLWNTCEIYPGRRSLPPIYSDAEIYENVRYFVQGIRNHLNCYFKNKSKMKHVVIIERKYDGLFEKDKLDRLENALVKNCSNGEYLFEGVAILENMSLKDQLALFSRTHVFFFRHGSCLANLLWAPQNSLVFDIDERTNRKQIVQRVCDVTKSTSRHVQYEEFDVSQMIRQLNLYLE